MSIINTRGGGILACVVEFKFVPLQHVLVTAYDLNAVGRVMCCEWDGHTRNYDVEYALDSRIERRVFFEDELSHLVPT